MNLLKKLRTLIRRPVVTVRELQDTGAVQVQQKEQSSGTKLTKSVPAAERVALNRVHEMRPVNVKPAHKISPNISKGTESGSPYSLAMIPRQRGNQRTNAVATLTRRPLSNIRAVRKMKHGHQSPYYRKSVRANVKPDEEETETI